MFTLIKNAHIYAPADTGCQDLLLAGRKIDGSVNRRAAF